MNATPTTPVLLVVGATGSIGRHVLACGIEEGYHVRALVRSAKGQEGLPEDVEVCQGDLTRAATLEAALTDVAFIVFTHGTYGDPRAATQVDYGAVRNVLTALKGRPVRITLMSTIGTTDRKGSHDWKRRGERLLRASGQPYTVVRPGWFDYNKPQQQHLIMIQGDTRLTGTPQDGVISRRQVAEVLVRSLRSEAAKSKTLELHAEIGQAQQDLEPLFASLDQDSPDKLDGIHDPDNMPWTQEPQAIRDELEALRGSFKA